MNQTVDRPESQGQSYRKVLLSRIRETIERYNMLQRGDRVIAAVSGGPDSVCLLDLLFALRGDLGIELVVAHLDHGLRPESDEAETRLVGSLADDYGLPYETEKAGGAVKEGGGSPEQKARDVRYAFLRKVKQKWSARVIAVGHTLDDQAETVLIRLLRGSGPAGLGGMSPVLNSGVIRPLIEIRRSEIEAYLDHQGLPFAIDRSNFDVSYLRNSIRWELLPQLKKYQPRIVEILGKTAEIMRADEAWIQKVSKAWLERESATTADGDIGLPLGSFRALPEPIKNRVIRESLQMKAGTLYRISRRHIDAIRRLTLVQRPQGQLHLPYNVVVRRVYDRLLIGAERDKGNTDFSYVLPGPGAYAVPAIGGSVLVEETTNAAVPSPASDSWTGFFDRDRLGYPLIIRAPRKGDRFIPLGMSGHKKVKDLFIDLKIPSEKRGKIPILTYEGELVWVCGVRLDDRFKVRPETGRVLKITFKD